MSGVGTFIYKESIGAIALKQIYNDFSGDLLEIRKNLIGNYLFALKSLKKFMFFVMLIIFLMRIIMRIRGNGV